MELEKTMKLKDLVIDQKPLKLEIDLFENKGNFTVILSEGKAKIINLPEQC